ncbi:hypothetical protein [Phenylobacterium sp.]|jgi:hypothetical protein|uniref:hypothetical protein n=1 Tax=Phenylobacterium sp. TaxID=1871053 RepID=UPI002E367294|nr:hypothetical protein [Phenylobacterium sp.]HEX4710212.1 hypothetical protein [Phenylobacterium sp.]
MLDALSITEAEAAGLSELAALDLAMARDFAARAQAAEDPEVANDLARSYQRMARSYRQSLALKVRLQAETLRVAREAPAAPRDEVRIRARVEAVRDAVHRVIWAEHEPAEAEDPDGDERCDRLFELLEERLDLLCRDNRFGLEPLDDQVQAVCRALGLDEALAQRWRDLPHPEEGLRDPQADADPPPWRGSG